MYESSQPSKGGGGEIPVRNGDWEDLERVLSRRVSEMIHDYGGLIVPPPVQRHETLSRCVSMDTFRKGTYNNNSQGWKGNQENGLWRTTFVRPTLTTP